MGKEFITAYLFLAFISAGLDFFLRAKLELQAVGVGLTGPCRALPTQRIL